MRNSLDKNWLRRSIEAVVDYAAAVGDPKKVALRRHYRYMASIPEYREFMEVMLRTHGYERRGYKGAGNARLNGPWAGVSTSADAEISGGLPSLRNRSRELERDDSVASGIFRTFVSNVIGKGMRPQAVTADEGKNDRMEAVWRERSGNLFPAENCEPSSWQKLIYRRVLVDGDHIVNPAIVERGEPVWFESVEGERVSTPSDAPTPKGHQWRDGVLKDEFGRPVKMAISKRHPGDTLHAGRVPMKVADFGLVDARRVYHMKFQERSGQTRGVPLLHAVLQDVRDLDFLLVAALKRSQIAACLAAFIKSDMGIEELLDATAKDGGYELDQPIKPGMIFKLKPGEDISTLIPNFPVPEFIPFVLLVAKKIGAALGLSWQLILKDFSGANYSSARTDLLESRQTFSEHQEWFRESLLVPLWRLVMEDAMLRGDSRMRGVTKSDIDQVQWVANGWQWVDPETEAKATQVELEMGTTTLRDVCASKGKDWQETMRQRARERKQEQDLAKEFGLKTEEAKPAGDKPGRAVPMVA